MRFYLKMKNKEAGQDQYLRFKNLEKWCKCQLFEIKNVDVSFTWYNKRGAKEAVFERLDRYFVNQHWIRFFPKAATTNLDFFGSDHRPILCRLRQSSELIVKKGIGRFHWEDKWLHDENLAPDFLAEWEKMREEVTPM